jgi:inner membrane protein
MTTENPQFAFSYEFIATESGLKAVEVPKSKKKESVYFYK